MHDPDSLSKKEGGREGEGRERRREEEKREGKKN